ncbi:LysR family transcriptional regulator [Spiractinospora alimapuensis]|uniref:LysR family transcriptional regulator n=1 Tax=Spiractinospora alimapuensis TaxID=2820884 RepID=UPI001F162939|nr:LysR family transcriptional regulator [Spiractinospora alimapuensis]QVQ52078.1 LysR family transcriptional regulator [Spiractinospora alimapuensis]
MLLRHLEYLAALARERHFARAAQACFVSQPALSSGIRKLEAEFGVMIVRRGNRFMGFTSEGERIVEWAHQVLIDRDQLVKDVNALDSEVSGRLRVGVIPTALSTVSMLTTPFCHTYPRAQATVASLSSIEIQRQMLDYEIDVGITYIDNEPLSGVRGVPLYRERYVLLTSAALQFAGPVTWREVAELPLCLLTPDMQNRRIINNTFRGVNVEPYATIETNSVTALCAHVRDGGWATVMPHAWLHLFGQLDGLRAVALRDPEVSYTVGLVVPDRKPEPPLVRAFREHAVKVGLQEKLDRLLHGASGTTVHPDTAKPRLS